MSDKLRRAPVLDRQEASRLVAEEKKAGGKVVFTNGCFDLIHPGHLEILEKARNMGTMLVVGLNTDGSVSRLKGPERPVKTLESRAAVLACIRFVDCVVPFEEDTPADLISALVPDILVKGGDYTAESVVGADTVTANGGRVEIIPILKGFSTSSLIEGLG